MNYLKFNYLNNRLSKKLIYKIAYLILQKDKNLSIKNKFI